MFRKTIALALALSFILTMATSISAAANEETVTAQTQVEPMEFPWTDNPFIDVKESDWFYKPVLFTYHWGISAGASANTFNPNGLCLRAQVITMLWRAESCPDYEYEGSNPPVNPFVDVNERDFFYQAVLWAVDTGLTTGVDATHFDPYGVCNRAQVVAFLYRYCNSPAVKNTKLPFKDTLANSWYTAPITWAVEEGITTGISATEFAPNAPCNRAQVVTFIYRLFKSDDW